MPKSRTRTRARANSKRNSRNKYSGVHECSGNSRRGGPMRPVYKTVEVFCSHWTNGKECYKQKDYENIAKEVRKYTRDGWTVHSEIEEYEPSGIMGAFSKNKLRVTLVKCV